MHKGKAGKRAGIACVVACVQNVRGCSEFGHVHTVGHSTLGDMLSELVAPTVRFALAAVSKSWPIVACRHSRVGSAPKGRSKGPHGAPVQPRSKRCVSTAHSEQWAQFKVHHAHHRHNHVRHRGPGSVF